MPLDKLGVVVPAAGQGQRMGAGINKQFLLLAGLPVLVHTLRLFQISEHVSEIVVVGAAADLPAIRDLVQEHSLAKVTDIVTGGEERQDSVRAGIKALSPAINRVLVHDGARPLLTPTGLNSFLHGAAGYPAAIMAVPLKDTIKRVDELGRVVETPPRCELVAVQTPQLFERRLLESAYEKARKAGYRGTDDASLVEWLGHKVQVIPGSWENLKVTTPEDLWLAEGILLHRHEAK